MQPLKIAILLESLGQPLRKALGTAAEFGGQGAVLTAGGELSPERLSDTGRRELRRLLESVEVAPAGVVFPSRRGLAEAEGLEARMEALRRTLAMSYQIGARVVCCRLGPIVGERDARRAMFEQTLVDLGRCAEHDGVRLALWTGSSEPGAVSQLLVAVGETGGLGVSFDPALLLASGFNPVEGVGSLGPWIAHVHVRDAVRGGSAESSQEVPLGQGEVDWPDCLGALEEADYRGYFAVERNSGVDPRRDVGNAVAYMRSLVSS